MITIFDISWHFFGLKSELSKEEIKDYYLENLIKHGYILDLKHEKITKSVILNLNLSVGDVVWVTPSLALKVDSKWYSIERNEMIYYFEEEA